MFLVIPHLTQDAHPYFVHTEDLFATFANLAALAHDINRGFLPIVDSMSDC